MMRAVFLLLIFLSGDEAASEKACSYQDILDHLNLTADSSAFKLTRPVLDHTQPTVVKLNILLYAILAVIEKTQTFIPFIWTTVIWSDERIRWDPARFCGITEFSVPQDILWRPDLFIYEMIEKDESPRNPFMRVFHDGTVSSEETIRVVCTCKIDVHKFPFDTQSCSITISSASYTADELRLLPCANSSRATHFSREVMQTQSEWEFVELTVADHNISYEDKSWDQLLYTFTVSRRPLLHVINFLLPILFFLCLDIASFFIADHRGEKLGFKVTVLLAISVLLLILNDILPAMSNDTPLIATYCIVIFALMLLSLLETILVTYLMEKDSQNVFEERDKQGDVSTDNSKQGDKRHSFCSCICKSSGGEKQQDLMSVAEEVSGDVRPGESRLLLLILEELQELQATLSLHLSCRVEGGRCTRWAARINSAFFYFYVCTVSLFLPLIFLVWKT